MLGAISTGKYGIVVMADLEGAFDTVWRKGPIYQLHKAGINEFLSVFSCFLSDRHSRNLVNSRTNDWFQRTLGISQSSILSLLKFLVCTADHTMEKVPYNCHSFNLSPQLKNTPAPSSTNTIN